jgi:predicted phage tail protein
LDRASNNDEIITLYGHRILTGDDLGKGLLGIPKADLLEIILYAHNKGLKFYRFSESFQPVRVSNPCDGTPPPPPPPPPNTLAAPSNLVATAISSTQINLTWQDNSSNEAGFKVERCTGATCTNFAVIKSTNANAVTLNNTALTANTVYRYRVRAFKGTLYSSYTTIVNAQTAAKPLTKPTSLKTTILAGKQIKLTWKDTNTTETGFKIERCANADCIAFAEIASVGANVLTFTDSGLQAGTEYRYQIRAFNNSGYSPYSDRSKGVAKP